MCAHRWTKLSHRNHTFVVAGRLSSIPSTVIRRQCKALTKNGQPRGRERERETRKQKNKLQKSLAWSKIREEEQGPGRRKTKSSEGQAGTTSLEKKKVSCIS